MSARRSTALRFGVALALAFAGVAHAQAVDPNLLEELPDVSLSQTIREQALALGNDPTRIYEFVRNELEYHTYYGLMKGPEGALRARSGNEYDLAALLVSLLRAAGVPARFARGRIEVTQAQAIEWTGLSTAAAVGNLWYHAEPPLWSTTGGIGVSQTASAIQKLHVWVEAQVGVARYRGKGTQPTAGLAWISLDPSFKGSTWSSDPNVLTVSQLPGGLVFNFSNETPACTGTDDTPEDCGYYNVVDPRLPLEIFADQVRGWLHDNRPDLELDDLRYRGTIRELSPGVLPSSLPYRILSAQRHASLIDLHRAPLSPAPVAGAAGGDDYRYRWRLSACSLTALGCGANPTPLFPAWERSTAALAGKRVTLSFPPTTATASLVPPGGYADAACSSGGGGIRTKPTLWVDGVATELGGDRPLCESLRLEVTTVTPLGFGIGQYWMTPSLSSIHDDVVAGGTYVLALDADTTRPESVREVGRALAAAHALHPIALDAAGVPCLDQDRNGACNGEPWLGRDFAVQEALVGGLLHLASVRYFDLVTGGLELVRELHHRKALRYPSTGLILGGIRPAAFLGAPYSVLSQRLVVDLKGLKLGALRRNGSVSFDEQWAEIAGHQISASEHAVWEEIAAVEAISTVKGLQVGASKGHTLLSVTTANATSTLQARCNGTTCSGLDRYAYCAIRNGFGTASHASSWSCAGFPTTTFRELRINACANFEYFTWQGYVYYAETYDATQYYTIVPTGQPESCSAGTMAYMPPARGVAAGGSWVVDLVPWTPATVVPVQASPFKVLDSVIFGQNSGVTNVVTAGDPVSVVTGNNQHTELDLQIAGRGGHDLRLLRSYNSRLDYDGPLGHGWMHTFDQHLLRDTVAARVTWRDESGSEIRFADGAGGLVPESGVHDSLVRNPNGRYTLTRKNGMVYRFEVENAAGRAQLLEIRDRNGNEIVCNYAGERLVSVADTAGRLLTFTWSGSRLSKIRDWSGREWKYSVDTAGDLVEFRDPVQSAADAAQPGSGEPVRYSYWSEHADPALRHNLKCWIRPELGLPGSNVEPLCGNEAGRVWMYWAYQTNDTVASHTDSVGRTTGFAFNFFRRRSSVTHPDDSTETYFFDAKGNVTRHENGRGAVRRFEYATGTRDKIREWDAFGNPTTASYDARGNMLSRADRLGQQETWSYDAFSQPTLHVDRRGNRREWEYNPATGVLFGEIATIDGTREYLREHGYDAHGNRIWTIAYRGKGFTSWLSTYFGYDATGTALIRITDPYGSVETRTVDALGRTIRVERARTVDGAAETLAVALRYDANDRVVEEIDPHGTARRARFDANGRLAERRTVLPDEVDDPDDPLDPPGRLEERLWWDAGGRVFSRWNALSEAYYYRYDGRDRLVSITTPLGSTEAREYDASGNLTRITDVSGRSIAFEYDLEDRPVRAVDGLGREARSEYDAEGSVVRRYGPGATSAGRLVYEALELDGEGNPTRERDAAAREYRRSFDEFGRLERLEGPIGLAENATTSWSYNLQGWLGTRIDGEGHELEVHYDKLGRVTQIYDGLDRGTTRSYDEIGNLVESVDPSGATMRYRSDARGLLLERSGPGVDDRYTYDDFGRRVSAANAVSAHRFRYDDLDRMVEHEGSLMGTARFAYDADGRLAHVVYPKTPGSPFSADAAVATYQYDEAGRVLSIHDSELAAASLQGVAGAFQFGWDAAGRLVERSDPNGAQAEVHYTPEGFVDALDFEEQGRSTGTIDYRGYDAFGDPGSIEYPGALVANVTYDARSRVKVVGQTGFNQEQFDYDRAGNRTRYWYGGDNRRYDRDAADQLTQTRRISSGVDTATVLERFVYDAAGRRTRWEELNEVTGAVASTTDYGYDGLGRLTSVDRRNGAVPQFSIDLEYGPLGERIRRSETSGSTTTHSLYLGGLVELRGMGGAAPQMIRRIGGPGPGGAVAEIAAPSGHLSGVRSVFGSAAGDAYYAVEPGWIDIYLPDSETQRFRSFGESGIQTGSALIERGYAGLVPEGASGLVEMGARHYDPIHGRFLQPDPIGIATDQLYAYAANNPFVYGDPLGLSPVRISGEGAAAYSGAELWAAGLARGAYDEAVGRIPLAETPETAWAAIARYDQVDMTRDRLGPVVGAYTEARWPLAMKYEQASAHYAAAMANTGGVASGAQHANAGVNALGTASLWAGHGLVGVSAAASIYTVATAPPGQWDNALAGELGAQSGGLLGGYGGAQGGFVVGLALGGPPGAAIGAGVGALGGAVGGAVLGHSLVGGAYGTIEPLLFGGPP